MPKSKAMNESSRSDAATYVELKRQLDEVLTEMQSPDCEVDRAAVLYEAALILIERLEKQLEQTENRVEKLHADFTARAGK